MADLIDGVYALLKLVREDNPEGHIADVARTWGNATPAEVASLERIAPFFDQRQRDLIAAECARA